MRGDRRFWMHSDAVEAGGVQRLVPVGCVEQPEDSGFETQDTWCGASNDAIM